MPHLHRPPRLDDAEVHEDLHPLPAFEAKGRQAARGETGAQAAREEAELGEGQGYHLEGPRGQEGAPAFRSPHQEGRGLRAVGGKAGREKPLEEGLEKDAFVGSALGDEARRVEGRLRLEPTIRLGRGGIEIRGRQEDIHRAQVEMEHAQFLRQGRLRQGRLRQGRLRQGRSRAGAV